MSTVLTSSNFSSFTSNNISLSAERNAGADPRVSAVQVNGQGLPDGSVVRWTSTNQKFYKIAGGDVAYRAIVMSASSEWNWGAAGQAA